ncbi:ferredoxin [Clostridium botulinum C]|uniref:Ferredoxin n=5 Tax=Clostridium TaxID=1485 RepID=A0A9Q4XRI9_CLOBO|nr:MULTISPECIES: ferredoxin [Clostridium]EGO88764.1 ferredoxin [Clostridium botulinum C str. Stockholm]AYF53661.1 ferredoxin [Clostridium novyi]EES91147.1 conserved domain protein [Clostridium botulinum D str. 1873]KEI09783.1 ferredoxin [Clostridium sp. K25]KEI12894.1 ferredoxin [Clostridium novyi B str. ATCC 27606]
MKAIVDQDTCIGCGLCPSICPEVFDMGDDGKAHVTVESIDDGCKDSASEARGACPVEAIDIKEE